MKIWNPGPMLEEKQLSTKTKPHFLDHAEDLVHMGQKSSEVALSKNYWSFISGLVGLILQDRFYFFLIQIQ